jgi:formate hydrogenlyase subunit 4
LGFDSEVRYGIYGIHGLLAFKRRFKKYASAFFFGNTFLSVLKNTQAYNCTCVLIKKIVLYIVSSSV